jgi:DNA-binding Xre family transcriptional regulator
VLESLRVYQTTNNAKAIRFSALEALCRALECQPRELLEFVDRK